jgi:hypothetical protein
MKIRQNKFRGNVILCKKFRRNAVRQKRFRHKSTDPVVLMQKKCFIPWKRVEKMFTIILIIFMPVGPGELKKKEFIRLFHPFECAALSIVVGVVINFIFHVIVLEMIV